MEDLAGKVVLITGAARGMGKLEALGFAREGCRVVLTDVDAGELEKTAGEMRRQGFEVHFYVHDISDREACMALAERVESEVGPVDVLVNNAGITECYPVLELTEASLRRMMDVNYFGSTWMMQAFVPGMLRRKRGHVVNICSIAGKVGNARMGGYCASKHALIGITDAIRQELFRSGVDFTIVNPGYVKTGMFEGGKVPFITSWQDPQKIADAVVRAVKKNQAEVAVPRFAVRVTALARGMMLPKLVDLVFHLLGQENTMAGWKKDPSRPF